jgi:hypothetical protein
MSEYHRRLPHYLPDGKYIFVTWRLAGSLPAVRQWVRYPTPGHAFAAQDRALDHGCLGPVWLKDGRIAGVVTDAIKAGPGKGLYHTMAQGVDRAGG